MSKRPKTANAVMSRLRRPAGRMRDLPIWSKLGLIMLVPTLATLIVGTDGLTDHISEANFAERASTLSVLSQAAGGLADHLQNERASAIMFETAPVEAEQQQALKQFTAEHPLVDAAKRPYATQRAALNDLPDKATTLLTRLDRNLEDLPVIRTQVANGSLNEDDTLQKYGDLIGDLLSVRETSAQLARDPGLSDHLRTVAAVARAKEFVSQQRVVGHQILGQKAFTPALRRSFLLSETGYGISYETLKQVGTGAEASTFDTTVDGPDKRAATNLITIFQSRNGSDISDLRFTALAWDKAMAGYNGLFRNVETGFDSANVKEAARLKNEVQREVFLETSVLLGMLLLAILFAWLVARSMARSLRELRLGALAVAQRGLPHAVARLRDPNLSSSLTPAQVADQIAEPLPVRSRDEFGQVTEAFNAVHLEAVRTAAEQAALRSSVATMFVNLARRSQILVDRLIGHLDRLERGEEDPDRLAELFQLDHLATRMRRNDENLLVLAGADSTRIQREPAALIDVLRAAQSEVEHYTRIEFGNVDRDIEVSAHAVNDMVHLVAELFDNATAFSPPNSIVMVEARRNGEQATLHVEDRGIGISREQLRELNERLANPPMVDVAVSRMMGLVVVARLADRHGVKVELRPAPTERGTVAEVGLPSAVLVPRAMAGRLQPGAATAFDSAPDQSAPRPSFAAPLALESGPAGGSVVPAAYPTGRPFDPNPPTLTGGMLGGGRSVPAWSDLTGAPGNGFTNGSNGSNGFHGPRSHEVLPPIPSNPQGYGQPGDDSLPRRRNGEPFPGDDTGHHGSGATIPRQLPANPENQSRHPFVPPVSAPPLPPSPTAQVSTPPFGPRPASSPPFGPRPVSSPPVSGPPVVSAPPVASGTPSSAPPAPYPSVVSPSGSYPVVPGGPPVSAPPASAPPAWPPVATGREAAGSAPPVPESLAAALDMTAEIPRLRQDRSGTQEQADQDGRPEPDRSASTPARPQQGDAQRSDGQRSDGQRSEAQRSEAERAAEHAAAAHQAAAAQAAAAQATAAAQIAAAQAAARQRASGDNQSRFADETMELPIFRELESAWFQTARPGTDDASDTTAAKPAPEPDEQDDPAATVVTTQRYSTADPARSSGVPHQASSPEAAPGRLAEVSAANGNGASNRNGANGNPPSGGWRTAADDGWQAARAAAEAPVEATTTAGLPRRTPMAQLVPGGVDRGGNSVQRRTPEAVRGLLSAYHRGVQRGRTKENPTNSGETPGGQQSSQAGKEHEA